LDLVIGPLIPCKGCGSKASKLILMMPKTQVKNQDSSEDSGEDSRYARTIKIIIKEFFKENIE